MSCEVCLLWKQQGNAVKFVYFRSDGSINGNLIEDSRGGLNIFKSQSRAHPSDVRSYELVITDKKKKNLSKGTDLYCALVFLFKSSFQLKMWLIKHGLTFNTYNYGCVFPYGSFFFSICKVFLISFPSIMQMLPV